MTTTGKAKKQKRVKVYANPEVKDFLTSKWLLTSPLDGMFKLPKVLSQMGLEGNVTAFFEGTDTVSFIYGKNERLILKLIPYHHQSDITCKIPDYSEKFTNYFATIRMDGHRECFYEYSQETNSIVPRFAKTTYNTGVSYIEVSKKSPTIRITFEVEKLLGSSIMLTVVIKNSVSDINRVDGYAENILSILNQGTGKNVYKYYEKAAKFLKYTAIDYEVSYLTSDGKVSDEVVIKSNVCQKYKITSSDNSSITLFDNRDWVFESPIVNVKRIGQDFSFSAKLAEFELDKLPPISEIEHGIRSFIGTNMWFAFEEQKQL